MCPKTCQKFFQLIRLIMFLASLLTASTTKGFLTSPTIQRRVFSRVGLVHFSSSTKDNHPSDIAADDNDEEDSEFIPPWNHPSVAERAQKKNALRSRQHVNPLARRFQMNTILSDNWPRDVYKDLSRPLFLDIGSAKGGFLLDVAKERPNEYNYLGLEIRPLVAFHARERIERHGLTGILEFVGCNVNVDLERLLNLYGAKGKLQMVTIQYPDPHFKSHAKKRRVFTPELIQGLAKFMPEGSTVFLQSDVQSVADEMRESFREHGELFQDELDDLTAYHETNLIGIPTEREVSVLERGLPVYRAVFKRTELNAPPKSFE
jgi:tRNA (guanine-N7-)-methyltransferase